MAYDLAGQRLTVPPASLAALEKCTPIYEEFPGWQEDITKVRPLSGLPTAAQNYLKKVEELSEVPIQIVSVGPDREETMVIQNPFG